MTENQFYGWFDDPSQPPDQPSYDPPHDGPCPLCGAKLVLDDIRTYSIMMQAPAYAKRAYFYRTHRTCAEKHGSPDDFIWDMIQRNGD